jgi:hypothetical protein
MTDLTPNWIDQTFSIDAFIPGGKDYKVPSFFHLLENQVILAQEEGEGECISFEPRSRKEAFQLSMIFRKASRRFEEIGKGMI